MNTVSDMVEDYAIRGDVARGLASMMRDWGCNTWVDVSDVNGGVNIDTEIGTHHLNAPLSFADVDMAIANIVDPSYWEES